jgi:hypothetical protein
LNKKRKGDKTMNQEVIKAMNKKANKLDTIKKWWRKNGYKVRRVIFFPVWFAVLASDKINKVLNSQNGWDEKRANEILNYYIPRTAHWDADDKSFYFFDNGMGWSMGLAKKYLKLKDRRFWKVNAGWGGYKVRDYLINNFELDGFTKEIGNTYDGWTEITFTMKEEV